MSKAFSIISLLLLLITSCLAQTDEQRLKEGHKLFINNCLPCHSVHHEMLGPQLASITKKRPAAWLVRFIRNSKEVILSGDEYANFLYRQYNNVNMPSFEHLSIEQVNNILFYIKRESEAKQYDNVYPTKDEVDDVLSVVDGQYAFERYCSRCHEVQAEILGPALGSVSKRRPRKWLYSFIQNPDSMERVNEYSKFLDASYPDHDMPPFGYLSKTEIDEILFYINRESSAPNYIAGTNGKLPAVAEYLPAYQPVNVKSKESDEESSLGYYIAVTVVVILSGVAHIWLIYKVFMYAAQKKYF